ncbi:hypothetical protein BDQ17DRAFT_1434938 [Cyathus striatus]|nr:hypothetical protein BDQ17DRAFT_1434938 [Cyathus striatus]
MPFGFRKKSTPPTNVQHNPSDQPSGQTRFQTNVAPQPHGTQGRIIRTVKPVKEVLPQTGTRPLAIAWQGLKRVDDNSYLQSSTSGNRQYSTDSQTRSRRRNETYPPPSASKSYPVHHESHQRNEYADKRPAYKAVQNYTGSGPNKEGTAVNFAGTDLASFISSGLSIENYLNLHAGVMRNQMESGQGFTSEQNYNGGNAYNFAGVGIHPDAYAHSTEKQRNQRR